ncbi:hypothetical protein [Edaphobacter acidisoli]|nr:hypothetical protein [Edaphobacter acidisoli]
MRERIAGAIVGVLLASGPAVAQMHKVEKPQQVVRAVGVYEWTGDMAKPTASRLVPIALFIDGEFQDAGVYMAQPVPFALDTGNIYELKDAGADKGTVTLEYARHLQTANGDYEDGWMGYGSFKAPAPPKALFAKRLGPARTAGIMSSVKDTADPSIPVLIRRAGSESTDPAPAASASANTASAASTAAAAPVPAGENNPADDPDRPVLKRPANEGGGNSGSGSSGSSTTTSSTSSSGSTSTSPTTASASPASPPETSTAGSSPESDPNRPTLKRRTPEEARRAAMEAQSDAPGMDASLNSDPNRPRLRPGKPAGTTTGQDLPKLVGMPKEMHQMVAVSDAVNRDTHVFTRKWEDAAERTAILTKIETIAHAKLTAYEKANEPAAIKDTTKKLPASSRTRRRVANAVAAPPEALMDEELNGYELSYGADPTYVYTARTDGTGASLHYVTVVAQTDEMGELKPVMTNVTDAMHLDRTPEMQFVDVVDADASNRASLLFELKEQNSRQFALYRVIAGQSQQVFLSGTTQ